MNARRDFRPIVKTHLHTSPIVVTIKLHCTFVVMALVSPEDTVFTRLT